MTSSNQQRSADTTLLSWFGLIYALRPARTRIEELCLLTFVGCLMSSAFTFWDAEAYRTFASTNALEALLVGLGVWTVYRAFGIHATNARDFPSSSKAVIFVSVTIVVLSLLAP